MQRDSKLPPMGIRGRGFVLDCLISRIFLCVCEFPPHYSRTPSGVNAQVTTNSGGADRLRCNRCVDGGVNELEQRRRWRGAGERRRLRPFFLRTLAAALELGSASECDMEGILLIWTPRKAQ